MASPQPGSRRRTANCDEASYLTGDGVGVPVGEFLAQGLFELVLV